MTLGRVLGLALGNRFDFGQPWEGHQSFERANCASGGIHEAEDGGLRGHDCILMSVKIVRAKMAFKVSWKKVEVGKDRAWRAPKFIFFQAPEAAKPAGPHSPAAPHGLLPAVR